MSEYRAVSRRRTKQIDKFLFLDAAHTVAPPLPSFTSPFSFPLSLTQRRANLPYLPLPYLTSPHPHPLRFFYHCRFFTTPRIRRDLSYSLSLWPLFLFLFFFPFFRFFSSCLLFLLSRSGSNNEKNRVGKRREESTG